MISRLTASSPTLASMDVGVLLVRLALAKQRFHGQLGHERLGPSFGACSRSRAAQCRGLPPSLAAPPHAAISAKTERCTGT